VKYFSGFCFCKEQNLFADFLEKDEFVVAGFSYGAQKALCYALNSTKRIDKIQLISPAFFDYNQKIIDLNLKSFKKDKNNYIKNFLIKAGFSHQFINSSINKYICDCNEEDLEKLFTFDWEKIKEIKDIKIEVFLGEYDKIISFQKAYKFFKNYANVYLIKQADHFLRS